MKTCNICLKAKHLSDFGKDITRPDGHKYLCRLCFNEKQQSFKYDRNRPNRKKNKELSKIASSKNAKKYPEQRAAFSAKRRAKKLNATPSWLTNEQQFEIKEMYALSKELSWLSESRLVIDHIIPLQGKNVTGLHVPWNLQIITEHENSIKSNKVL